MNRMGLFIIPITIIMCVSAQPVAAVKIVECEDEQGNKSFSKTCPPGYSVVGEKKISTGTGEARQVDARDITATIYLVPECAACDEAKEFLNVLGVNLNVINIADDIKYQNTVKELAGELRVPVTVIGDKVIPGYSRDKFESAVKAAGLKQEEGDTPADDDSGTVDNERIQERTNS